MAAKRARPGLEQTETVPRPVATLESHEGGDLPERCPLEGFRNARTPQDDGARRPRLLPADVGPRTAGAPFGPEGD